LFLIFTFPKNLFGKARKRMSDIIHHGRHRLKTLFGPHSSYRLVGVDLEALLFFDQLNYAAPIFHDILIIYLQNNLKVFFNVSSSEGITAAFNTGAGLPVLRARAAGFIPQ
jgi:hypothetical protein